MSEIMQQSREDGGRRRALNAQHILVRVSRLETRPVEILLTLPYIVSVDYKVKDHSISRATKLLMTSSQTWMCIM